MKKLLLSSVLTLVVFGCSAEDGGNDDFDGNSGVGGGSTGGFASGGFATGGASGGETGVGGGSTGGFATGGFGTGGIGVGGSGGVVAVGGFGAGGDVGVGGAGGSGGEASGGSGGEASGGSGGEASGGSGGEASGGSGGATGGSGGGATGGSGGTGGATGGSGGTGGATGGSGGGSSSGVTGVGTTNLFVSLAGKTQNEVDQKVTTAVNRFFGIGTGESNTPNKDNGYRCYYELPNDSSMAFIWAPDSDDIRSEGMSYGMMIAVQMGMKTQFDKLWKFAKTYSQYPSNTATTPWRYYFKWQNTDGSSPASFNIQYGATEVPAPDGDEYFAAALYLAHQRWGSAGTFNYKKDADDIADAMIHNAPANSRYPIIHATQNMIVFVPYGDSNNFTDPSYHLPAFYELFAEIGPSQDSAKWRSIASTSRSFLVTSAHPSTGLHPDYATFAGSPHSTGGGGCTHDRFCYDAWRVVMNMAIDYAWYSQSSTMRTQVEKYHAFFADKLSNNNVTNALFSVDGSGAGGGGSTALVATLASGALASNAANRASYVNALWNVPQQQGLYRYYQESVYLLGLLATAGKFSPTF